MVVGFVGNPFLVLISGRLSAAKTAMFAAQKAPLCERAARDETRARSRCYLSAGRRAAINPKTLFGRMVGGQGGLVVGV